MKCAIYCRLSREDEGKIQESESIQNQKNLLVQYALEQGWEIYHIYSDEDYSGADRERPQWNDMLAAARAGRFQVVLCKNQSRFTRDMEMVERYLHGLFPLWGIRFVAVLDHVDTGVRGNKKARQINGLVNEWYLEDLSENIRAVLDQKRRDGKHIGSTAAYGYRKDPDDRGRLVVDEAAAATVRRIFRLYLEGMGTQKIAAALNGKGVPSPGVYKGLRAEGAWTKTAISRILRSEIYTGSLVQGTKRKASYKSKQLQAVPKDQWIVVANTHQPIIGRDTFEAVGRLLGERTRSDGTGTVHLLAGKVFCAGCGGGMQRLSHTYKGRQRSYLQCAAYGANRRQSACSGHTVRLDILTQEVTGRIAALVGVHCDPQKLAARLPPSGGRLRSHLQSELDALEVQAARLERALSALYLDRVEGIITPDQFASMNRDFSVQIREKRSRAEDLSRQLEKEQQTAAPPETLPFQGPTEQWVDRELVDLFIERILVGERDSGGKQPVTIVWKV